VIYVFFAMRIATNTCGNDSAGRIDPAFAKWMADRWQHAPVGVV